MYIVNAEANQIQQIVEMSIRAFETDVNVGGAKGDCPPEFDSIVSKRLADLDQPARSQSVGSEQNGYFSIFDGRDSVRCFEL